MKHEQRSVHPFEMISPPQGKVEVLLATYNNADYLEPLLDSLLAQSFGDFHLVISDDCSTDDTVKILKRYLGRFQNPVRLIERDRPSGSAAANFAMLMQQSHGDFVFLCDGDDVWYPDKLKAFLAKARPRQDMLGPDVPMFLFSDASIISADGAPSGPSYWAYKNTDPARCLSLQRLLVCTPMLGCASMMNRALVQLACNVPLGRVTGHDWWALLVAASLGEVGFVDAPTIAYRVHGKNASQPMQITLTSFKERSGSRLGRLSGPIHEVRRRIVIRQRQAEPLLEQFGDRLSQERRQIIEKFLAIKNRSFVGRRLALIRNGFTYPDGLRNAALLMFC